MSVKNPFVISGYVSPYYFCDREEAKTLIRCLTKTVYDIYIYPQDGKNRLNSALFSDARNP